jgi:hypothetical protein
MSFTAETTNLNAIAIVSTASNNTVTATESSTDRSTDSNTWTKQDEEEGQIKIMMRRARGHFEKARVNRYSSTVLRFGHCTLMDPLKITQTRYRDISLSRFFFSKKITL